ncbi:hypothetical protein [Chryseobacterium hagamense]|uniref:Lipoprotein n=1 Tax=Chryseobacterium hagamense TaxID=395935 RepID=A0A511YS58_9FLAO|nr:hypothetical protein [Chryseobacterium hagamense]GEN78019.1 hypothetical protein CHA01nite_37590 [Chryseobacterium hagamense]
MKKLILTAACMISLSACNKTGPATTGNTVNPEQRATGADKDDHGCMASAGQTWSELKHNCIQVFNEGFRLNPVKPEKGAAVISAFVLMSDDKIKAELFLPDAPDHQSIILTKANEDIYQNGQYKYDAYQSVLYVDGVEKYKGNVE